MRLKSARCQSMYWEDGNLLIVNYLTRRTFAANPVVLEIIRFFYRPGTIEDALLAFGSYTGDSVGEAIVALMEGELLLECSSPGSARDDLLHSSWKSWLPEGAFHFLTKDAPYVGGDWTREQIRRTLPRGAAPAGFKTIEGAQSMPLPLPLPVAEAEAGTDSFYRTLYARRTQREFSAAHVPLEDISRLLQMTWGVQGYVESQDFGVLPRKTSPSAGARNPIEVYVMALRVADLAAGLYHYDARGHALAAVAGDATPERARAYCAGQPFVAHAAALFFMTAVFGRTRWKYPNPRAYRVVLLDAGHLGQTFCLTATRLGLAPFCTAALKDSLIEKDLGLDGIEESVVYVTGVGLPPAECRAGLTSPAGDMSWGG